MQLGLIKRMVITEKYIYSEPQSQSPISLNEKLQTFQETQEKNQESVEQETQNENSQTENDQTKKQIVSNDEISTREAKTKQTEQQSTLPQFSPSSKKVKKSQCPTYAFDLDVRLTKPQIKIILEKAFNVDIVSLNTYIAPMKKKRVGFNQGYKSRYKRAMIKLKPNQKIQNPLDKPLVNKSVSTK